MQYYSALKKKETLPFMTTWMNLENFMLSEISQSLEDRYYIIPFKVIDGENKMVVARA